MPFSLIFLAYVTCFYVETLRFYRKGGAHPLKQNVRIGDVLISRGFLTDEQLGSALQVQKADNSKRLGEVLIAMGYITEDQLLIALADRLSLPIVDLNTEKIDLSVVSIVPKALCTRYRMVAIARTDSYITLAVNDPLDFYGIEDVKSFFDRQCELVLCKQDTITATIQRAYSEIEAQNAMNVIQSSVSVVEEITDDVAVDPSLAPIVNLVNSVIIKGFLEGASDIHFEPFEKQTKVRIRVDGLLVDYMQLESHLNVSIVTRIKILAELDIAERRIPQDGNFKLNIHGERVGIRVSTIPTTYGEKIVLRFLSRDISMDHSEHYGMNDAHYEKICRILQNPHGMIYITGPTGSGKTTTLYMMVERLARQPINVSTIEDPVERRLDNINQVQVNPRAGLTFESGLRSMLRQDPDVILVGETRDNETAQIAISAAITGHLVLSTLHTNDAVSSIIRLQNMDVPAYLVANSLVGVVAQRLVKKVCPFCRTEYVATEDDQRLIPAATKLVRGRGCNACNHTGYKGRIAVHEILELDTTVRNMVAQEVPSHEIYDYVRNVQKMTFIRDDIESLVLDGVTTMDEYKRNCSMI